MAAKPKRREREWTRRDALKLYSSRAPDLSLARQDFRFTLVQTRTRAELEAEARGRRYRGQSVRMLIRYSDAKKDAAQAARARRQERVLARSRVGRSQFTTNVGGVVESCEWRDEGGEWGNSIPVLRGTLQYRPPHRKDEHGRDPEVLEGDRIRCDVFWGGSWCEVWTMRVQKPVTNLVDGTVQVDLADDAYLLARSEADFSYKKSDKKRGRRAKGWQLHEIVGDVARNFGFRVSCVKGQAWITNLTEDKVSPLELIRKAVEEETAETKSRYAIFWRNGRLHVQQPRRNYFLYMLREQIVEASLEQSQAAEFATAYRVRGTARKKGSAKRKTYAGLAYDPDQIARHGYIERDLEVKDDVASRRQLRNRAAREMERLYRPVRKLELTHTGMAFLRRFDAVYIDLPEFGFKGTEGLMWVSSVTHTLSAGQYTMALTLRIEDVFKGRSEEDVARRARARERRRNRRKGEEK